MRLTVLIFSCGLSCCGGDDDPSCGEPTYFGDASDEVWRTMVDADHHAVDGDPSAPALVEPDDGAEVSAADDGLRISWTSPIAALGPTRRRSAPGLHDPSWLEAVGALVEGTAWAHLPPVTGDVYWVRLTIPGRACAVEAMTTDLEWTVAGADWDAVKAAKGQTVQIDLTSAYLNENRITEGPYRAPSRSVTIAP